MRSFSKNKLLLCFRPVAHIDAMLESKVAAHRSSKQDMMKSSESKHMFVQQGSSQKFSRSWIMQNPPKRTISKVIKAVVFATMLNRRASQKNSYGSKQNYSTFKETTKTCKSSLSTLSLNGSVSSSSSPKLLSEIKNLPTKEQQKEGSDGSKVEKQKKFELYAMFLVLISLAFTVFWGKIFGIILTSIWLYFFSLWNSRQRERVVCNGKIKGSLWKVNYHNGH